MSNGDTITACPNCNDSHIYRREWRAGGERTTADTEWRCQACGHEFGTPVERASRRPPRYDPERRARLKQLAVGES